MIAGYSSDWTPIYYVTALVIFGLAGYRITRLLLWDHVLDGFRAWVWRRRPPERGGIGYLLTCPWCTGFWVSSLLVIAYIIVPGPTMVVAVVFAISAVIGLLAARDGS